MAALRQATEEHGELQRQALVLPAWLIPSFWRIDQEPRNPFEAGSKDSSHPW
jgi:hypothetical protein